MTLAMRLYTAAVIAVLALCFALVVAMVLDVHARPNSAGDVISSIGTGGRGD